MRNGAQIDTLAQRTLLRVWRYIVEAPTAKRSRNRHSPAQGTLLGGGDICSKLHVQPTYGTQFWIGWNHTTSIIFITCLNLCWIMPPSYLNDEYRVQIHWVRVRRTTRVCILSKEKMLLLILSLITSFNTITNTSLNIITNYFFKYHHKLLL